MTTYAGYVPIGQAARHLGVSIDTLRRWDQAGLLSSQKLDGKNRYYSLMSLEARKANRLLTTSEVATILHISVSTVRRLERQSLLRPIRNGNNRRGYMLADVEKYQLHQQQIGALSPDTHTASRHLGLISLALTQMDEAPTTLQDSLNPGYLAAAAMTLLLLLMLAFR